MHGAIAGSILTGSTLLINYRKSAVFAARLIDVISQSLSLSAGFRSSHVAFEKLFAD
jgi:hypothetical protein